LQPFAGRDIVARTKLHHLLTMNGTKKLQVEDKKLFKLQFKSVVRRPQERETVTCKDE